MTNAKNKKAAKSRVLEVGIADGEKGVLPVLVGSSVLPALVRISEGNEVQLGDIVGAAYKASNLSVEGWNELPDDEREAKIAAQVEVLKSAEAAIAAKAANAQAAKNKTVKALVVKAKADRFHRAGYAFTREETTINISELSDEQIAHIKGEPLLVVSEIEVAAE